jgi:hypothetical protein
MNKLTDDQRRDIQVMAHYVGPKQFREELVAILYNAAEDTEDLCQDTSDEYAAMANLLADTDPTIASLTSTTVDHDNADWHGDFAATHGMTFRVENNDIIAMDINNIEAFFSEKGEHSHLKGWPVAYAGEKDGIQCVVLESCWGHGKEDRIYVRKAQLESK